MNPLCQYCNKKMKSKGKNQGFKCIKCGKTSKHKTLQEIPREIKKQLYVPVLSAHRHLTRPLQRLDKFNKKITFDGSERWFYISRHTKNQRSTIKILN